MRIEVTAEYIAKGKRGVACECAIARALIRMGLGSLPFVQPWGAPPYVQLSRHGLMLELPGNAAIVARNWDDGEDVEPFAFELDVTP